MEKIKGFSAFIPTLMNKIVTEYDISSTQLGKHSLKAREYSTGTYYEDATIEFVLKGIDSKEGKISIEIKEVRGYGEKEVSAEICLDDYEYPVSICGKETVEAMLYLLSLPQAVTKRYENLWNKLGERPAWVNTDI